MKTILAILMLATGIASAQTAYPALGGAKNYSLAFVPGSSGTAVGTTVLLNNVQFSNTSGSSVSVTLADASTACGGSTCSFWPAITIAANTVYTAYFNGRVCPNGITWSATSASAVVGYLDYAYPGQAVASLFEHGDALAFLASHPTRNWSPIESRPLTDREKISIDAYMGEAH